VLFSFNWCKISSYFFRIESSFCFISPISIWVAFCCYWLTYDFFWYNSLKMSILDCNYLLVNSVCSFKLVRYSNNILLKLTYFVKQLLNNGRKVNFRNGRKSLFELIIDFCLFRDIVLQMTYFLDINNSVIFLMV
jgi:hypothetical protein